MPHLDNISKQLNDGPGFLISNAFSDSDLSAIRSFLFSHWSSRIINLDSSLSPSPDSILNYHLLAASAFHKKLWPKLSRMFDQSFISWFQKSDFFSSLSHAFGDFIVSDEESLGYPNFYWRISRPFVSDDIGPPHRDEWFWLLQDPPLYNFYHFDRIKVWVPIHTVPKKNGLLVEPFSHHRSDVLWTSESRDGKNKPSFSPSNHFEPVLLDASPGQAVLFHDRLLHAGSSNTAQSTRYSFEFTILAPLN